MPGHELDWVGKITNSMFRSSIFYVNVVGYFTNLHQLSLTPIFLMISPTGHYWQLSLWYSGGILWRLPSRTQLRALTTTFNDQLWWQPTPTFTSSDQLRWILLLMINFSDNYLQQPTFNDHLMRPTSIINCSSPRRTSSDQLD